MPSHCRTIETQIWGDERFLSLSPDAKLVFVYAITCDQSDWSGIFRMSIALAEESIGITKGRIKGALEELSKSELVHWDESVSVIWITNMWRKQLRRTPTDNHTKGVMAHLAMLANTSLKQEFCQYYQSLGFLSAIPCQYLGHTSPEVLPYCDRERIEEEKEKEEEKSASKRAAQSSRKERARTVIRWIAESRRRLGIASRESDPGATQVKQANKPLDSGHSLADWETVIRRAEVNNRGNLEAARKYLTLSTLHRPDNFARLLERDDLDGQSQPGGDW